MEDQVLITDIQKFSVNDGPGFRTIVFLKGCPMRCEWCHNPETMAAFPEIYWKKRLCVQCGACLDACPRDAIAPPIAPEMARQDNFPYHKILREKCDRCMKCVDACRYDALCIAGKPMSIDAILAEVEKDRLFYDNSGGGMTISGGEPTLHPEFVAALLKGARERGIHSCLDTNGSCDWPVLAALIPYVDIFLYDIKHLDPEKHRQKTGVDNRRVTENLARLLAYGARVMVRIPVIPDFNDSMAFHRNAAQFLSGLPGAIERVDLLAFHNWCQDKYGWLGLDWAMKESEATEPSFLEIPAEVYREHGLPTTVGGSGFESPLRENIA